MSASSERTKEIGRAIIGNLNADGYLRASVEELQEMGGYTAEEVKATLDLVSAFDPVGCAARDLTECLTIQLKHLGEEGSAAETIVKHHMDKLQNRKYKELAEALGALDGRSARRDRDHQGTRSPSRDRNTTSRAAATSFPTFTSSRSTTTIRFCSTRKAFRA